MKEILISVLLFFTIASCTSSKKLIGTTPVDRGNTAQFSAEGSSFENAVIIMEKSESKGVDAEYAWIRDHFPGYRPTGQSLTFHGKKPYDIIKIENASGDQKSVYFNISSFYGKF
jgi:hypothetical protein